jgi:hypothetical protein
MNSFSGYLGLPNISYVTADDLDIANLGVDTITVNTEAKVDNIQPLTNTSSITIGLNTNTGIIDFQQDVDVNADLEADNITTTGQINTDNIQPLLSNSNLVIGTTTNTGILDIRQNTTVASGKKITTPDILVSSLTPSKLVLTDASDNLVSSLYTDSDFPRLSADNTFTGTLNTFQNTTSLNLIKCNTYTGQGTNSILNLGESGDTGSITINKSTSLASNRTLTLNATGGVINCNSFQGTTVSSAIGLFTNTTGNVINIGNTTNGNAIVMNQLIIMAAGKDIYITSTGTLRVETIRGDTLSNPVNMYLTQTGAINFGNTASTNPLTINNNTVLATNKNLTLQGTGKITTPNILVSGLTASKLVLTDASDNLISSLYDETTLPVSTPTQTALNLKADKANPTFTGVITAPEIRCPLYNSTNATTLLEIGKTNTTAGIIVGGALSSGNIDLGLIGMSGVINLLANVNIGTSAVNKGLTCNYFQTFNVGDLMRFCATTTTGNIRIGESQSTGNIVLGHSTPSSDSGGLTINKFTTIATGKSLTLSSTSNFISDNIRGTGIGTSTSIFPTTTTGSITIGTAQTSGNVSIGNSTPSSDSGGLTINKITTFGAGKDLLFSSTGRIRVDRIVGSTPLTSDINLGYTDPLYTADILLNQDAVVASNRTLSCNTYRGLTVTNDISLFSLTTSGNILMGEAQIGGSVYIGNLTPSSDSGSLFINKFITLAQNKTLTTGTGGSILCPTYNSTSASQALTIGGTNTISDINIGGALTTALLQLGSGTANGIISRDDLYLTTGVFPSITRKTLYCNTIRSNSTIGVVEAGVLYDTNTTNNITIASGLTTGLLILGNRLNITTGYTLFNHRLRQIRQVASIDRASFWNVAAGSANNIFQSSFISGNAMPPVYAAAGTDGWSVWESDAEGEASFIAQNGNTTVICNPGDNSAFHWQDEDNMLAAAGFKFSTAGVMTTSSDRRLKRDIKPIPVGNDLLDKLSLIQYVNYKKKAPTEEKYFKNGKLRQKYQDIHKGLIAQDVKQIFPEVVEKEDEYHMMKYAEVDIYFNMGVQELIKRDKEKQAQIDSQKLTIDNLTERLVRLEQILLNQ